MIPFSLLTEVSSAADLETMKSRLPSDYISGNFLFQSFMGCFWHTYFLSPVDCCSLEDRSSYTSRLCKSKSNFSQLISELFKLSSEISEPISEFFIIHYNFRIFNSKCRPSNLVLFFYFWFIYYLFISFVPILEQRVKMELELFQNSLSSPSFWFIFWFNGLYKI